MIGLFPPNSNCLCVELNEYENGEVYQLRPDFLMPYMVGKTEEMEKPLYLCQFGVPFEAIAYVFGRNA